LSSKQQPDFKHESKSIREKALRILPHREAQERRPRHLQEYPPQTAAGLSPLMISEFGLMICAPRQATVENRKSDDSQKS
jgi:hypothetical protein